MYMQNKHKLNGIIKLADFQLQNSYNNLVAQKYLVVYD